jgi:hypothetical protein
MVEDAMTQMRLDRNKLTMSGRKKAQELIQQGQTLVVEQLDRVSDAAQAGEKGDPKLRACLLSIQILRMPPS